MRRDSGITLIELVVAMALFALVAVMSLQALTGMLRARDRLAGLSQDSAQLSLALTLLRRDMAAAVPVLFHTPAGLPVAALEMADPGPRLGLSLAGQAGPETPDFTGFHRVEWRYDSRARTLTRQAWPVLHPARESQRGPAVAMLEGVTGFGLRFHDGETGWQDWSALPPGALSDRLPDALEVTLSTERHGRLVLVEAFR